MVKRRIAQKNVCGQDVAKFATEAFQSVAQQEWKNCVDYVIKIENEYFTRGGSLYNDIDKFVISVSDDNSGESEESEMDQFNYAGASGNISGIEYLDSEDLNSD
ncbi:unnamed protein product [Parnassius apollo]|uniref:(apollo) hypothetical protein n=1 Tax=Parnassius apollo TaxID=110799 RepID=A0A8S3WWF5_PARAO|nr:unnamed protein product [Parnassius apollo]